MSRTIAALRSFDRKERFAVLREALGFDPEIPRLAPRFREKLNDSIDKTRTIRCPKHAYLAMDYHLDWIEMALHRAMEKKTGPARPFSRHRFPEVNRTQKDVDLLIAFDRKTAGAVTTHLVLIEAKAYLGWDNPQLDEKAERLGNIFGDEGDMWSFARPHFILMSAKRFQRIQAHNWPKWMRDGNDVNWLDYDLPNRLKITRCTEKGDSSKTGSHLVIKRVHP